MIKYINYILCLVIVFSITACKSELTVQNYMDAGQKFLLEENYEKAVVQFTKVIELEPQHIEAHYELAEAYYKWALISDEDTTAFFDKATEHIEQVQKLAEETNTYYEQAGNLIKQINQQSRKTEETSVMEEESTLNNSEQIPTVTITDMVNEEKWEYTPSGKKAAYYSLRLPEVFIESHEGAAEKINLIYKNVYQEQQETRAFIVQLALKAEYVKLIEAGFGYLETKLDYQVLCNDGKILSIEMKSEEYYGGAHGEYYTTIHSFDVNTGDKIELSAIAAEEEMFKEFLVEQVIERLRQQGELEYANADNVSKDSIYNYCLNAEGIRIVFNIYEIAPYAAGIQEVVIPYENCMSYFNDYGKYLVSQYDQTKRVGKKTENVDLEMKVYGDLLFAPISYEEVNDKVVIKGHLCDSGYADTEFMKKVQIGDIVAIPTREDGRVNSFADSGTVLFSDMEDGYFTVQKGTVEYMFRHDGIFAVESIGGEWPCFRIIKRDVTLTVDADTEIVYCEGIYEERSLSYLLQYCNGDPYNVFKVTITNEHIDRLEDNSVNYAG